MGRFKKEEFQRDDSGVQSSDALHDDLYFEGKVKECYDSKCKMITFPVFDKNNKLLGKLSITRHALVNILDQIKEIEELHAS